MKTLHEKLETECTKNQPQTFSKPTQTDAPPYPEQPEILTQKKPPKKTSLLFQNSLLKEELPPPSNLKFLHHQSNTKSIKDFYQERLKQQESMKSLLGKVAHDGEAGSKREESGGG